MEKSQSSASTAHQMPFIRPKLAGRVLIVEDDPGIRKLLEVILRSMGLTVIKAKNSSEAMETFTRTPHIRAVITDICLPGRNGVDLASDLLSLNPDIPIILLSGFSHESLDIGALIERPSVRFIQKPFSVDKLESTLRVLVAV